MAALSGNLATMCPGVPYALAAKFAYPERPVIACVGDGAMQMVGNNALIDIAKYWERWEDPRLTVLVLHNDDLNQVTWEQRGGDLARVPRRQHQARRNPETKGARKSPRKGLRLR
jgi:thiamine pyrophosphate-dependent acetolactate synthase large subunit-like protein